jgi:hypothetical protein
MKRPQETGPTTLAGLADEDILASIRQSVLLSGESVDELAESYTISNAVYHWAKWLSPAMHAAVVRNVLNQLMAAKTLETLAASKALPLNQIPIVPLLDPRNNNPASRITYRVTVILDSADGEERGITIWVNSDRSLTDGELNTRVLDDLALLLHEDLPTDSWRDAKGGLVVDIIPIAVTRTY